MKKIFMVLTIWIIFVSAIYSQVPSQPQEITPKSVVFPNECGFRLREMVVLLRDAKPNRPLVIVSHLGGKETKTLGEERLFNAKTYLTSSFFTDRWNGDFIVLAEGNRVTGNGYIDFFLDGELALRILLEANADLYLGDCGAGTGDKPCANPFDAQFFPCRSKTVTTKRSR